MNRNIRVAITLAVLILATSLRIAEVCKFSLDNDEIAEVSWVRLPWRDMMEKIEADKVHPPFDYAIQHLLTFASVGECGRRVPGVLAGIGTVGLVMLIALRAFGWSAAVATGLLLAASPLHIRYSQEIRPYALGLFFLSASIATLVEYRRTVSVRWIILWFCCIVLAAYTLYFAAVVALITSFAFIFFERNGPLRSLWRSAPFLVAAAGILYAPWLSVLIAIIRQRALAPPDQLDAGWFLYRLQVLATGDWRVEPVSAGSWILWLLAIAGCVLAWRNSAGRALVTWFIGGLAIEILILQLHPHPSAVRHLLPAWIALFPLAGAAISSLTRVRGGTVIAAILCAVVVAGDARTVRAYYDHGRPDWRTVAEFVASRVRKNEQVFAADGWVEMNFGYYWREAGQPVALQRLPPGVQLTLSGPAWIVIAGCPMDMTAHDVIERQELRLSLPYTNHCQVRYLPKGSTIVLPRSVCLTL